MDSIPPQKPIDTAKMETDIARASERLRNEQAARGRVGGDTSGAPTPESEARALSPEKKTGRDFFEKLECEGRGHRVRMAFLFGFTDRNLTPEVKRLKKMLETFVEWGHCFKFGLRLRYYPDRMDNDEKKAIKRVLREKGLMDIGPDFLSEYQLWYTAALAVLKLVLPSRLDDFIGLYEYPAKRSQLTKFNYRIADAMRGHFLTEKIMTRDGEREIVVAGVPECIELVSAQCDILEAAATFLTSPLSNIQQGPQVDLLDSELHAASELREKGFNRAAGAMAGVILKRHLDFVMAAHAVVLRKKNPAIHDYGKKLKEEGIVDVHTWSFIQRLGDLYNRCFTVKDAEPKNEDIDELFLGVDKIIKTVF